MNRNNNNNKLKEFLKDSGNHQISGYYQDFVDNNITLELLISMDDQMLKDLRQSLNIKFGDYIFIRNKLLDMKEPSLSSLGLEHINNSTHSILSQSRSYATSSRRRNDSIHSISSSLSNDSKNFSSDERSSSLSQSFLDE